MPTPNKILTKNHPANQIIGSKEKRVMTRNKVQVEPKNTNEACKDDH